MPSIQSAVLEFWIRQLTIFSTKKIDPLVLRKRIEQAAFRLATHRNVKPVAVDVDGIPSEWLVPKGAPEDRAVFYIHGGAWFMGSTHTHRSLVSNIAYTSGVKALSINYRLAPEHPFPAGLMDCLTAYRWLLGMGYPAEKIIVAGDSAGGNLTLALLIALRDSRMPLPAGAICLSPATDLSPDYDWDKGRLHHDPYFSNVRPNSILEDYFTYHDPCHPLISPLYANLTGLPPLLIQVGEHEVLLDCVKSFAERASAAGIDTRLVIWPGMFHVFHIFSPFLPEAREAIDQMGEFIRSRLRDQPGSVDFADKDHVEKSAAAQ